MWNFYTPTTIHFVNSWRLSRVNKLSPIGLFDRVWSKRKSCHENGLKMFASKQTDKANMRRHANPKMLPVQSHEADISTASFASHYISRGKIRRAGADACKHYIFFVGQFMVVLSWFWSSMPYSWTQLKLGKQILVSASVTDEDWLIFCVTAFGEKPLTVVRQGLCLP